MTIDVPDAPCHYSAAESSAWQSGFEAAAAPVQGDSVWSYEVRQLPPYEEVWYPFLTREAPPKGIEVRNVVQYVAVVDGR